MRARPMTTLSGPGNAPPESPVPAPRATMVLPCRRAAFTAAATSAVEAGSTAATGRMRVPVRPSHS